MSDDPGKELLFAVSDTDYHALRKIFARGVPAPAVINYKNNGKNTPLIMAPQRSKEKDAFNITKMLLEVPSVSINDKNKEGMTAIMFASRKGYATVVELLLQAGAEFEDENSDGMTVVQMATDKKVTSLLQDAVKARRLAEKMAIIKSEAEELLDFIHKRNYEEALQFSQTIHYPETFTYCPNNDGVHAFGIVVHEKCLPLITYFLDQKADLCSIDRRGRTVCMDIILMNRMPSYPNTQASRDEENLRISVLKSILETNMDLEEEAHHLQILDKDGLSSLMHACLQGYDEDVRMILTLGKANADLKQASKYPYRGTRQGIRNKFGDASIHLAARRKYVNPVRYLVELGHCDIDLQGTDGMTALMWACWNNHWELVVYLRRHGANPNIQTEFGVTALMWALEKGNFGLAWKMLQMEFPSEEMNDVGSDEEAILQHHSWEKNHDVVDDVDPDFEDSVVPIDIDIVTKNGGSALSILSRKVDLVDHELLVQLLKLFLDKKANSNVQTEEGLTPLMWASYHDNKVMVKFLLQQHANPKIVDINGKTAMDWASTQTMKYYLADEAKMVL